MRILGALLIHTLYLRIQVEDLEKLAPLEDVPRMELDTIAEIVYRICKRIFIPTSVHHKWFIIDLYHYSKLQTRSVCSFNLTYN